MNDDLYSHNELIQFASSQKCTVEEFQKRWIIHVPRDILYVFCEGKYWCVPRSIFETSFLDFLSRAPIDFTIKKKKGNKLPKAAKDLIKDYGSPAIIVRPSVIIQNSYYDIKSRVFFEAICSRRNLQPEFDQNIHNWFQLLGGEQADKLLDWIATITDLSKFTVALYLSGPPSCGKTLFGTGLSRLWTLDGFAEGKQVIGTAFNSQLTKCPLIVFDEQGPVDFRGRKKSAELREIIGKGCMTLRRKYREDANIDGAPRLIFLDNNESLLNFDEELTKYDLQALANRFLHISVSSDASVFLKEIGGTGEINSWIQEDKIAKHALWLRDNREVQAGSRFLVESDGMGNALQMLGTNNKLATAALEWIISHISRPNLEASHGVRPILVGNGAILVTAETIVIKWEVYNKSPVIPRPGSSALGRALSPICLSKRVQLRGIDYRSINIDILLKWVEQHSEINRDYLLAKINTPISDMFDERIN